MAESVDERLERLMKETGGGTATATPSTDEIEQRLNQDMGYQMTTGPDRVLKRKEAYAEHGLQPPTSISPPGKKELDEEGPVHKYVRPALELGGMMGGAVLGAAMPPPFTGPIGGTIGGGLGYAGGDTLASLVERLAGERPPVQSVEQALSETGRAVTGGGALEMGSRVVGRGVGGVVGKVLAPFAKQYEGASKTLDEVAQSKGIQLDPHEILQSRPVALAHKTLENVPFTSGMIQRKELQKVEALTREWTHLREATGTKDRQRLGDIGQKIQDTVEKELDRIGVRQGEIRDQARDTILQSAGSPLTYKELGDQSQTALKEHYAGKKALEDVAWEYARESVPSARVVTSNLPKVAAEIKSSYENIPSFLDEPLLKQLGDVSGSGNKKYDALIAKAKEQIPEGLPTPMRQKLLTEMTSGEQPGWRVDDLLKLRSELSSAIQEHHFGLQRGDMGKGSADAYGRVYTKLLKAVDADLEVFGTQQGSDIAQRFAMARAASGERLSFFNPKDHPAVAKAIMADPAKLASVLIQPGSAAGFTELKTLVGTSATAPVKHAFTNRLLGVGGAEAEGLPLLRRKLDQYGSQTLKEVYTPQEVKDLYHLADQSRWMKQSPIGNPFFRELIKTAPAQVAPTILGHPDLTAKVIRQWPQMRGDLRQAFVDGLHPNQMTPFPTQMLKTLNAYPAGVQTQLFSKREIRDFYDLAQITERTKGSVKMAENPSGTAQGLISFSTGSAVLRHPITMAPTVLSTSMLGKLYLSPLGRRFLLEGLRPPISPERAAYVTSQILGIAGVDAVRDATEERRMLQGIPLEAGPRMEQTP
jgi:hypothetical protein